MGPGWTGLELEAARGRTLGSETPRFPGTRFGTALSGVAAAAIGADPAGPKAYNVASRGRTGAPLAAGAARPVNGVCGSAPVGAKAGGSSGKCASCAILACDHPASRDGHHGGQAPPESGGPS